MGFIEAFLNVVLPPSGTCLVIARFSYWIELRNFSAKRVLWRRFDKFFSCERSGSGAAVDVANAGLLQSCHDGGLMGVPRGRAREGCPHYGSVVWNRRGRLAHSGELELHLPHTFTLCANPVESSDMRHLGLPSLSFPRVNSMCAL
jgi:hypothetical protein